MTLVSTWDTSLLQALPTVLPGTWPGLSRSKPTRHLHLAAEPSIATPLLFWNLRPLWGAHPCSRQVEKCRGVTQDWRTEASVSHANTASDCGVGQQVSCGKRCHKPRRCLCAVSETKVQKIGRQAVGVGESEPDVGMRVCCCSCGEGAPTEGWAGAQWASQGSYPPPGTGEPHCGRTPLPRGTALVLVPDSWKPLKDHQKPKLKKKRAKKLYFISFHSPE